MHSLTGYERYLEFNKQFNPKAEYKAIADWYAKHKRELPNGVYASENVMTMFYEKLLDITGGHAPKFEHQHGFSEKDGHFNRTTFENRTIDIAVKDINEKSKCIQNLRYEKVKKGNRVQYYLFTFNYTDPQKVVEDARNERRWEQLSLLDDIPIVEKPVRVSDEVKDLNWWE